MKNNIWLMLLFMSVVVACFDDNGSYDYAKVEAPAWKDEKGGIVLSFRVGETATFKGSPHFSWNVDSLKRASEVTYEWKLNGEVLSDQIDFEMPVDELVKRIGLVKIDEKAQSGTFSIIEKSSGVRYIKNMQVTIQPTNASKDWFVLSEDGGNAKLSFIRRRFSGGRVSYELREDVYTMVNGGQIVGKPEFMAYSNGAKNIGKVGTLTIVTSENNYEVNCENFMKVGNLEEVPVTGKIKARHDAYVIGGDFGSQTFIVDEHGKIFRRMMSNSDLAGEFGKTPMVLDADDYQISLVGYTQFGYSTLPCYDALNRRMVSLLFYESGDQIYEEWFPGSGWGEWKPNGEQYKLAKLCSTKPAEGMEISGCAKVWDMPAGTKPLHTWYVKFKGFMTVYDVLGLIYNDASGKTWLTEYTINPSTGQVVNDPDNKNIEFSGGNLPEGTLFLTASAYKDSYLLYSTGNEIRYLDRNNNFADNAFITLENGDKVTFMAWTAAGLYYELVVGTEQGNVIIYDTPYGEPLVANPKIIQQFNLGGRIVSCKELNQERGLYVDKY